MCGTTVKYSCNHQVTTSVVCKKHKDNLRLQALGRARRSFWRKLFGIKPKSPRCHSRPSSQRSLSPCHDCIEKQRYAYICSRCRIEQGVNRSTNRGLCCSHGVNEWNRMEREERKRNVPFADSANERTAGAQNSSTSAFGPIRRRYSMERAMVSEGSSQPGYHQLFDWPAQTESTTSSRPQIPPRPQPDPKIPGRRPAQCHSSGGPRVQATVEQRLQDHPSFRERRMQDRTGTSSTHANRPVIQEALARPKHPTTITSLHPVRSSTGEILTVRPEDNVYVPDTPRTTPKSTRRTASRDLHRQPPASRLPHHSAAAAHSRIPTRTASNRTVPSDLQHPSPVRSALNPSTPPNRTPHRNPSNATPSSGTRLSTQINDTLAFVEDWGRQGANGGGDWV